MKTTVADDAGRNPIWNEEFVIENVKELAEEEVVFVSKDEDLIGDKYLGTSEEQFFEDILEKIVNLKPVE